MKSGFTRRLQRGTLNMALCAAVIAVVILLNVLVTALCSKNRWFIDMTSGHFTDARVDMYEGMYTLTDDAQIMLQNTFDAVNANRTEENAVKVEIIFCAEPDLLCLNDQMRYIYYTALEMEKAFPDSIEVSTTDVWSNPSSVDAYRTNSYSSIYQTNVIVASGTEFRVYNQRAFYTYSETTDTDPWAYSGEKTFVKGIIAVTKAEAPIACLTYNHGEPFATEEGKAQYSQFLKVLDSAGYEVQFLDLKNEEIPENCRLIITMDPQEDFASSFMTQNGVSEIDKLDKFLGKAYSFMILADADTPKLTNLEEFLEEWGISFNRYSDSKSAGVIYDGDNALDGKGLTFMGIYEEEALGGSVTKDMREVGGNPKIVFSNALGISYSPSYEQGYALADEEAGTGAFTYGYYSSNSWSRDIYDLFRASETALIYEKENGQVTDRIADTAGSFKLMTLSRENRTIGEGQGYTSVNDVSYVCAIGSTDFASNEVLSSNAYGNTDLLLSVLRTIGREIVPVGINFKPMYSGEASETYLVNYNTTALTVVLILIPALAFAGTGTVVLVKRKFRK
ncbi:MAG: Gldg family protein [Clostridia bacterium]|nr:Gldg family protein [Clostridia bacterium]